MGKNKSGQVTIFIIVGLVLAFVILAIAYFGGWIKNDNLSTENPTAYMKNCILDSVKKSENIILESNTYPQFNSDNYILYNKEKIPYLCTVSEFYSTCTPQDSAFFIRIKKIMENKVAVDTQNCLNKMYKDFDKSGYDVQKKPGELVLEIFPEYISARINETIYAKKDYNSYSFSEFESIYYTNLYGMLKLTQTIVNYESTYCEFNKLNWMKSYNDIIISTTRTSDSTKVYTLQDRLTDRKIKFAIKTCVLPAGI
jgi:hypothetical protein